jgi:hypothetical protein
MNSQEFAAWRREVGISQEELATRWARVSRTTIQNWESGATPIPDAVEAACDVWGRRLKQENPLLGPVTLIYADGPMFVDPYGPRRPLAMMHQEPYPSNTAALARVLELGGGDRFYNPFIIERSGNHLWNLVELNAVVRGDDSGAPTAANLLRRLEKYLVDTSAQFVRTGPRMPNEAEIASKRTRIEELAAEIGDLAKNVGSGTVTYVDVEQRLQTLRSLGKFPPEPLVSAIAQAFRS